MLDREDLQAIAELMDKRIGESENRMKTLIDQEVTPKFNLLAEGQSNILEKLDELGRQSHRPGGRSQEAEPGRKRTEKGTVTTHGESRKALPFLYRVCPKSCINSI